MEYTGYFVKFNNFAAHPSGTGRLHIDVLSKYSQVLWGQWRNGMLAAATGDIVKDKTIVSGHWHCSWGHATFDEDSPPEWGSDAVFTPYYSKGIIAIDACTAYSGFVNCLVLED